MSSPWISNKARQAQKSYLLQVPLPRRIHCSKDNYEHVLGTDNFTASVSALGGEGYFVFFYGRQKYIVADNFSPAYN